MLEALCDPNFMSQCHVYPRRIAAISHALQGSVVPSCLCMCSLCVCAFSFAICSCVQTIRPLPNQPDNGFANTPRTCSVFVFPWFVFFPLPIFVAIQTAAIDLRSAVMGFAVHRRDERGVSPALSSQPRGASRQRSQGRGDHVYCRDSPRISAERKAAKNSL